jgi:hypothetical protein
VAPLGEFERSSAFFLVAGIVVSVGSAAAVGAPAVVTLWVLALGGLWPFIALAAVAAIRPMTKVAAAVALAAAAALSILGIVAGLGDSSSTAGIAIPSLGFAASVLVAAVWAVDALVARARRARPS